MRIITDTINVPTDKHIEFVDITDKVRAIFDKSGLKNGLITVTAQHTTATICVNEKDERLQGDMKRFLTNLIPPSDKYSHNTNTVDGRPNAHSHIMSLFLKNSETVQFINGEIQLGTWQSIFLIELDGPRENRTIKIMIMGE